MTALPRALVGSVQCMARPRRPVAEAQVVRRAAAMVVGERGLKSAKSIAAYIAERVVAELDRERDADPLELTFAAVERALHPPCPIHTLASCPEINTAADFLRIRVRKLQDRSGRYLAGPGQAKEGSAVQAELRSLLASRYGRVIRKG